MAAATPKVELVYDPHCPNVDRARERLRQAIGEGDEALAWTEWRSDDQALPDYARGHGSPTILIDERDVAADHSRGSSCRLCDQGDGTLDPAPIATIIAALATRVRSSAAGLRDDDEMRVRSTTAGVLLPFFPTITTFATRQFSSSTLVATNHARAVRVVERVIERTGLLTQRRLP